MKTGPLSLFFIFLACLGATAQLGGLRSPSTRFLQIESDTARIIYPQGLGKQAADVAASVHEVARIYPIQDNDKLRKISIILHDQTAVSNGFVALAPWRSELYLAPPPNSFTLGSTRWEQLLAIHEFRHVQQRSAGKRGVSKLAYWLFGEQGYSVFLNMSWPNWYVEGDAVIAETALTNQGRGRLPSFLNAYRAKVLSDGKQWNYQKARNGSFKDFVPSHYHLGYLMMDHGRKQYSQHFWDSVALHSAAYRGVIYPFSRAVKMESGISTTAMYKEMLAARQREWDGSDETEEGAVQVTPEGKRYEEYSSVVFDESGNLYAVVTPFNRNTYLARIDEQGEPVHLKTMGYLPDTHIGYGGGKICWAERRLHPRWLVDDYSVIIVFDIASRKTTRLSSRTAYFSPAPSSDGSKILVSSNDELYQNSIKILDASTGVVLTSVPNAEGYYFTYPAWSPNEGEIITAARNPNGQMAIVAIDLETQSEQVLTRWSNSPVGRPMVSGDWIYFTASSDLTDQLFRVHVDGTNLQRITTRGISKYDPAVEPSTGDVYYARFSLLGNKLMRLSQEEITPSTELNLQPVNFALEAREWPISPEVREWDDRKYGTLANPVNVHSWNPFFEDPWIGVEVLSQNVLSSVFWDAGFQYNINDDDYGPFTNLTISTWYPEILLGYSGLRRRRFTSNNVPFKWFSHDVSAGLRLPWKGLHGPYSYSGALSSRIHYQGTSRIKVEGFEDQPGISFQYLSHRLVASHKLKQAFQHPISRFAQAVDIDYSSSIDSSSAGQFQIQTDFTFPGVSRNHVLWLQADYRNEPTGNDRFFSDGFHYARGYNPIRTENIYRLGVNYHLPVLYPDFGIAGIIYFKRVRLTLFGDYSRAYNDEVSEEFRSTGAEFIFDVNFLNIQPFGLGFRYAYRFDEDPNGAGPSGVWEFFLPILRF